MRRPVLRYFGGKFRLRHWVISHFPPHDNYVEPFGGAASVLLSKPRVGIEIYNDLDDCIVNLFRVLRDPERALELQRALALTPYARQELEVAFDRVPDDPVEDARRTIVRAFQGIGSDGAGRRGRTGFRSQLSKRGGRSISDWFGYPPHVEQFCERMLKVIIESKPAAEIIERYDSPTTLHYVDPPYVLASRSTSNRHGYQHEMSDDDHRALLDQLCGVSGMVVLSGYDNDVYGRRLEREGWECYRFETRTAGIDPAVECLWKNPQACDAHHQQSMFSDGVPDAG